MVIFHSFYVSVYPRVENLVHSEFSLLIMHKLSFHYKQKTILALNYHVGHPKQKDNVSYLYTYIPIGSMYAIYSNMDPMNIPHLC